MPRHGRPADHDIHAVEGPDTAILHPDKSKNAQIDDYIRSRYGER
jgi:hypothetical protein